MPFGDQLLQLEQAIGGRRTDQVWPLALQLLAEVENAGDSIPSEVALNRLAAALASLLCDPGFELPQQEFNRLSHFNAAIAHVFYLSGFRTADHCLALLKERGNGGAFAGKSDTRKFILGCSLWSRFFPRLIEMLSLQPQAIHSVFLRNFAVQGNADERIQANRNLLLAATEGLTEVVPRTATLAALHQVWALCSYSSQRNKHDAKKHINRMIQNWLSAQNIQGSTSIPLTPSSERPMLLVPCEVMSAAHVMYRCYAPFLRQLRQRFRVVGLFAREDMEESGTDWCDEVRTFSRDNTSTTDLVREIILLRPDVILYPCLGMRLWSILLCNLRLALVQIATLGHPATTHSPHIDCMIVGREMLGSAACFSEKVVVLKSPGNLFELRADDTAYAPVVRERPGNLRVAVCGNLLKLNGDFLGVCRHLSEKATRPVELHVFPNSTGLRYQVTRKQIEEFFGPAQPKIHPRVPYAEYRRLLGDCDLFLSPFPFGGENSALDAVLHGLPLVTLEGDEPHSRLDARIIRLAELPDWLITHSVEEYLEAALRLIEQDDLRCTLARSLQPERLRRRIDEEKELYATDFVDAVYGIHTEQH